VHHTINKLLFVKMAVYRTLDALVSINVVNQHRARLVLRWPFAGLHHLWILSATQVNSA